MPKDTEVGKRHKSKRQRLWRLGKRMIYSRHMLWGIGTASFLESIIIPLPLEAILIPLMQARRRQMLAISTAALAGCLAGASTGYLAGQFIMDWAGSTLIEIFASQSSYQHAVRMMASEGFWFVFSVGVIPVPFQIAMLAAGATQFSFPLFILASLLSRGIRYYGLAILVLLAGNQAQALFDRNRFTVGAILVLAVALTWWLATA